MASALGLIGVVVGVALGAWLSRRHGKRAQAERLLFGAGPVDVESWARGTEQVGESVVALAAAGGGREQEDAIAQLAELAQSAPSTAVLSAFGLIEHDLQRIAQAGGLPTGGPPSALVDMAARADLVTPETASAVRGLVALRNLAAHGRAEHEVTPSRAREYVALVQAVLFALSRPPRSSR